MGKKTRIVVTHQLHILPFVDRILYLEEGRIKFFGTNEELENSELKLDVDRINPVLDQSFNPHRLAAEVIDSNSDVSPFATPTSSISHCRSREL